MEPIQASPAGRLHNNEDQIAVKGKGAFEVYEDAKSRLRFSVASTYVEDPSVVEEQAVFPWRLEPRHIEDLVVQPEHFAIPLAKPTRFSGLGTVNEQSKSNLLSQNYRQWSSVFIARSSAGSIDSVPPLTDDCSRDTDGIAISEPNTHQDDLPSLRTSFKLLYHEYNTSISPHHGDGGSPNSSQQYSRTPELRVSHKLAERKRRLEMNSLFDTLRTLQNVERGDKALKWEILSKAISEHERQTKVIEDQKKEIERFEVHLQRIEHDLDISRHEANAARRENAQLRLEISGVKAPPSYHAPVPPVIEDQKKQMLRLEAPLQLIEAQIRESTPLEAHQQRIEAQIGEYTSRTPFTQPDSDSSRDEDMGVDLRGLEYDDISVAPVEDSEDSESIWKSDYSESAPVLEEGHPFLAIKPVVLREALLAFQDWRQRPRGSSRNPSTSGTPAASIGDQLNKSSQGKRGRATRNGRGKSTEDDNEQGGSQKRPRASKKTSGNRVSFACPFTKKDPLRYRSCYAFILNRIQDVKQHLSRCHQLPIYCPRCMTKFESENERDQHARIEPPCPLQAVIAYEGVTKAQKAQLSQRVSPQMAHGDQWFTIFDILFPGHTPRPRSAYVNVDLTEDLEASQDLMHAEGPNIIATAIRSSGIQVASMANEERDLSALLQAAIEEGLQIIAQRWSANVMPDSGATLAPPDEQAHSLVSHSIQDSQPSRTSSDTLVNPCFQTTTTNRLDQVQSSDVISPSQPALQQEYHQTIYPLGLEDAGEFWKLTEGQDFFPAHECDDTNPPVPS